MRWLAGLLAGVLWASCSGGIVVVERADQAKAAIGKRIRFQGRAGNAKLAAAVLTDGMMLYCLDRPEWPAEVDRHTVIVEGTLERTDEFMARTGPDGARSAGTGGSVYVLRKSDMRLP